MAIAANVKGRNKNKKEEGMKYFSNHRRIGALAAALLVTVVLTGSSLFVLTHLSHECTGEGCRVCSEIGTCVSALHLLSEAVGGGAAVIFAYIYAKKLIILYSAGLFLSPASLVRLKVRMDD